MTNTKNDSTFEQVVHRIDPQSKLVRTRKLTGGVSAQVTALEIEHADGQTQKMIVRQHGEVDLKHNPHIAADEFKLLNILHSAGLATPVPYDVDESSMILATPYIVVEYIEGTSEFKPTDLRGFIHQLARHLANIHTMNLTNVDLSFLPQQAAKITKIVSQPSAMLDDSLDEGRIRATLQTVWPPPQHNQSGLLHGDYWPGNILWRDNYLVGLIDWEDAAFGDPLADLGNTRLEILWALGMDAMHDFTLQYQSMTPFNFTNLPYWDLCAALRPASKISEWAADEIIEKNMREGHHLFITQAFNRLSKPS